MNKCKPHKLQHGDRQYIQAAEKSVFLPTASSGTRSAFWARSLLPHATGSIHGGKGGRTSSSNELNIMLLCRPIAGIWQVRFLQQGPIEGEREGQGWIFSFLCFLCGEKCEQQNSPVTTVTRFCVKLCYPLPILPSTQNTTALPWLAVNGTFPQGCSSEKAELSMLSPMPVGTSGHRVRPELALDPRLCPQLPSVAWRTTHARPLHVSNRNLV